MAITATDRGAGSENASTSSVNVASALTGTMAAGSTGVLVFAMDNANAANSNLASLSGSGLSSNYVDSQGNVWYLRLQGLGAGAAANAVSESAVFSSRLTHTFASTDTLTISFVAATVAKAWTFTELVPGTNNAVLAIHNAAATGYGSVSGSTNTTAPTITSGDGSAVGDCAIGYGASESADNWTQDSGSTGGTWSTKQSTAAGSGTGGMSVITQSKIITAYGAQSYSPTLTTADARAGIITFTEANVKARCIAGSNTSQTSSVFLVEGVGLAANSLAVACISLDNSAGTGDVTDISSFADSKSNTWTQSAHALWDPAAASGGVEVAIYTSVLTTPLVAADTLTLAEVSSTPNHYMVLWEFAPAGGNTMSVVTNGTNTGAVTSGTGTITTSSITNGDTVIAMLGQEGTNALTPDGDTTNGTWMTRGTKGNGTTAASSMAIMTQWKTVTATATQAYDVGGIPNPSDTAMAWVSIHEATGTGLTAAQKAAFFQMF